MIICFSKKLFRIYLGIHVNTCIIVYITGLIEKYPTGPGEMGKAVIIPPEREAESKEKFKINQFNLVASEMMSLNRSLPDYRIPG